MQGKVIVRRDAGQVVAGDSHIGSYTIKNASHGTIAVAFFWAL